MTQGLRPTKDFIETWVKQFRTDNPRKQTLNALEIYTELEPAAVSAAGSGEIVSIRAQSDMSTINDILKQLCEEGVFQALPESGNTHVTLFLFPRMEP
jgi:hypothetical protein